MNKQQNQAIEHTKGQLLVIAAAGSGKTSVITKKISHLINNNIFDAKHIVAMTFTNKAAKEMQERLTRMIKPETLKALTVSTFHTFGYNFLKQEYKQLDFDKKLSLFDEHDSTQLLTQVVEDNYGGFLEFKDIRKAISSFKNQFLTPENVFKQARNEEDKQLSLVYQNYNRSLKACNAVDFDDLIMLPVLLLITNAEIKEKWQQKVQYLLVDEYQDTNPAQYQLIKLLIGSNGNLTAVGDDDQSIYAFRGARPKNINLLTKDYPNLEVIKLEQNYRSTKRILNCANSVIKNNQHLFEKELWTNNEKGEKIIIKALANEQEEALRIAKDIFFQHIQYKISFNDFAILVRSNRQIKEIEFALQTESVPYKVVGDLGFFALSEIKDLIAYLRLINNELDNVAFSRIINTPKRKIGIASLEKITEFAHKHNLSFYQACKNTKLQDELENITKENLQKFIEILENTKNLFYQNNENTFDYLLTKIDYQNYLIKQTNATVATRKMRNLGFLIDQFKNSEFDYDEKLSKMILQDILSRHNEEEIEEAVQIMTLHASKGLEFNNVFIVGLEEGILPHKNSIEEENIDEERRIMYVGITRAKKNLTLTYAEKRKTQGNYLDTTPSRFLEELPLEEVVIPTTESIKQENIDRKQMFDKILQMLDEE